MSRPPSLDDCRVASRQCLAGIAEAEKDNSQERLGCYVKFESGQFDERAVGGWIIKRKRFFQVRSGQRKPADKQQVSPGRGVTQNETGGIVDGGQNPLKSGDM
jgi:hypothetical protein